MPARRQGSHSSSALLQVLFPRRAAAWQDLETGSTVSSTWRILQAFYGLTENVHYTKGPPWFISYTALRNELQCWRFCSTLLTQAASHLAGKYLFLWVQMPKWCKADLQARQCFKLSLSTTASPSPSQG